MAAQTLQVRLTPAGEDLAQGGLLNIQRGGGLAFAFHAGEAITVDADGWAFLSGHPGPGGVQLFELVQPIQTPGPVLVVTGEPGTGPAHLNVVAAHPEETHGLSTAPETK